MAPLPLLSSADSLWRVARLRVWDAGRVETGVEEAAITFVEHRGADRPIEAMLADVVSQVWSTTDL